MLLGPSVKSQISGAFYSASKKRPTGGCTNEEVALRNRRLLHSGAVGQTTKEVHAMYTTTQRLSSLLVATLFIVLLALMATFGVRSAEAAQPVGECPASYEPGLVTVKFVLKGAGLDEPDPSMDGNGDGYTCLKLLDTGSGTRATWHDNNL
jgi:hypothetical protein